MTASDEHSNALDAVDEATRARRTADEVAAAARDAQSAAIRRAIAAGAPVTAITARTGLSVARVYQIRDGRR